MQVRFHVFAGGIRGLDLLDHVPQVASLAWYGLGTLASLSADVLDVPHSLDTRVTFTTQKCNLPDTKHCAPLLRKVACCCLVKFVWGLCNGKKKKKTSTPVFGVTFRLLD